MSKKAKYCLNKEIITRREYFGDNVEHYLFNPSKKIFLSVNKDAFIVAKALRKSQTENSLVKKCNLSADDLSKLRSLLSYLIKKDFITKTNND
jgi:hypothetical protein